MPSETVRRQDRSELDEESKAAAIVDELHELVRQSVMPYRPPTSEELRQRMPILAKLVAEEAAAAGISDEEACAILQTIVSRMVEARIAIHLSETLANSSVGPRGRSRPFFGRFGRFALSNG